MKTHIHPPAFARPLIAFLTSAFCLLAITPQAKAASSATATNIIAAGAYHSLYVTSDGTLYGVGSNSYAQLGFDGGPGSRSIIPVQIASNVVAMAGGNTTSFYVTSDGKLYAMGRTYNGQLGNGIITDSYTTTPVYVAPDVVAVAAGVGGGHAFYLTSNLTLYAMGDNSYGQLGDGSSGPGNYKATPVQVATNVIAMAAGGGHSLYVTSDGNLYAMGNNSFGQLGDGTTTDRHTPVYVASNVVAVAAGNWFSLFVTSKGDLYAMGGNSSGQLGDGTGAPNSYRATPVHVASNVVAVAAGAGHSLYVTKDGKLYAMGANAHGELGDGTTTNLYLPKPIAYDVIAVAGGYDHSLYVTTDGHLCAMGWNTNGPRLSY